jgi:hypothetical protein
MTPVLGGTSHWLGGKSMTRLLAVSALSLAVIGARAPVQRSSVIALVGVWRPAEARDAAGRDVTDHAERTLYIFTRRHFSIQWADTARSRVSGAPTDSQKVAMWQEFGCQAGTYEVSHDTLTLRTEIAKSPQAMAPRAFQRFVLTRDSGAIWLQLVADDRGPLPRQERARLVRVE